MVDESFLNDGVGFAVTDGLGDGGPDVGVVAGVVAVGLPTGLALRGVNASAVALFVDVW